MAGKLTKKKSQTSSVSKKGGFFSKSQKKHKAESFLKRKRSIVQRQHRR